MSMQGLFMAGAGMAVLPAVAAGTSVSLRPGPGSSGVTNGDAFVTAGPNGEFREKNFGGAGVVAVAAPGSPQGEFMAVMRFDVSSARSAFDTAYGRGVWRLDAAQIQLTASPAVNPIFNPSSPGAVTIHWIGDDSWTEGGGNPNMPASTGLRWNQFPELLEDSEILGSLVVPEDSIALPVDYPLRVVARMAADVAEGTSLGFALTAGDGEVAVLFNSRSFPTLERRPMLTLTAVPVLPEIREVRGIEGHDESELVFTAMAGLRLTVESSTDLAHWGSVKELVTVDGVNVAVVPAPTADNTRYWRLTLRFHE